MPGNPRTRFRVLNGCEAINSTCGVDIETIKPLVCNKNSKIIDFIRKI